MAKKTRPVQKKTRPSRKGLTLTKRDLAAQISRAAPQITILDALQILQQMLDCMAEALLAGRPIEFRDFGVFEVAVRKARVGRNPNRPQDIVRIPERRVVKFKPGKLLKQRLAQPPQKTK